MISADLEVSDFPKRTWPLIQSYLSPQDSIRTAVLAECCLMYLSDGAFREVLSGLADNLQGTVALIIFDPLFLGDSFGRTMSLNLQVLYLIVCLHNNTVFRGAAYALKHSRNTPMKLHTDKGCPSVDGRLASSKV